MQIMRKDRIGLWCKSASLTYLLVALLLLFGVAGTGDERFAAVLTVRAEQFPTEASLPLAILELAIMVGAVVTIWFGSKLYFLVFAANLVLFGFNTMSFGPFLTLGIADAILSFLDFAIQGFAVGLVLMRRSLHIQSI